jgi:uncharacterized membrane protein
LIGTRRPGDDRPHLGSLRARTRLIIAATAGILGYLLLPEGARQSARMLIAWDVAISVYLAIVSLLIRRSTPMDIKDRAQRYGDGGLAMIALAMTAAGVSIAAIVIELASLKQLAAPAPHLALAALTIALSWIFTQVMFALHYAHAFHLGLARDGDGGLDFPKTPDPDYRDFLYFSFMIGCASQTSDVITTNRRMRRPVMIHGIFSFFFNIVVLALSINIGATAL